MAPVPCRAMGAAVRREGVTRLDADIVAAHAQALGAAPGLPGADIELPAVPRAGEDLARAVYSSSPGTRACSIPHSNPSHNGPP